ncbi:hypothetical protein AYO20_00005 [Fonsecaea nubica]|uniref:Vegetative cell wall protein gp1 n=2 Tax=Fonsecaea TaxID=40354 RepID=A0A0D2F5Y6_9EURO|nr:uncharacterized protein Z517_05119 [Fonsecaea pedrosoi CBS 271.37]XP_022505281.1 hypothetical protein AYO20_00005 [Fonsecaea nubica]KIW82092.1 hypothetical protein Z517_05119 [Fonsecaea pedrosoi CBS 271.37]OAL40269.1 hypothetical protein AYO20_00005 [Fonsecaea nubica]
MSYHYGVPPSHYTKYYGTSSPYSSAEYVHYAPQYDSTPKKHARRTSYTPSPRVGGWYSPAGSPPPHHEPNVQYSAPRDDVYVSEARGKTRNQESYHTFPSSRYHTRSSSRKQNQPIYVYDDEAEYARMQPNYVYREPKSKTKHARKPSTDTYFYYGQEQIIDEQPKRSRARRASSTSKPTPKSKPKPAPQATEEDAIRAGIPAGYSIKHWDPTELPIILLGSVFDANSLGKWIYDWTVFHHGASTPIADIAGELWLLLIKLAGKMKRAEECVDRIRNPDKQETVEDFIVSGKRLWEKFKALLKDCEHFMLKAAKREGSKTMGKKAGTEFVDSIFGRDRHLEATEKIMNQIRLWNMRFDVNCEETLRRPSVA